MSRYAYYGVPTTEAQFFSSGSMAFYSSGSSYSMSVGQYGISGTCITSETKRTWVCHYCGSTISEKDLKCSQCAGEKRDMVSVNTGTYANITYESDNPVAYDIAKSLDDGKGSIRKIVDKMLRGWRDE